MFSFNFPHVFSFDYIFLFLVSLLFFSRPHSFSLVEMGGNWCSPVLGVWNSDTFLSSYRQQCSSSSKEAYTDGSKRTGRKVGYAAVFTDSTRIGALPEEASIHTAEMKVIKIARKEIKKREDIRWVIYTDSLSSMQAIENNRENHLILNQIYGILTELPNYGKQLTLCTVPAHIAVKWNE